MGLIGNIEVGQRMGNLVFQVFVDIVCYGTAKVLLPALSFGRLQVQDPPRTSRRWWGEPPFHRMSRGRIGVHSDAAAVIGLLIWIAAVVLAVMAWRYSN